MILIELVVNRKNDRIFNSVLTWHNIIFNSKVENFFFSPFLFQSTITLYFLLSIDYQHSILENQKCS